MTVEEDMNTRTAPINCKQTDTAKITFFAGVFLFSIWTRS